MKIIFALLVTLVSAQSFAGAKRIDMECMTGFPTTSFIFQTVGDSLEVQVINHNGMKYAPTLNGTYVPNDLPLLQSRAAMTEKLSPRMTFKWKLDQCEVYADKTFWCRGSKDVQEIGGMKVNGYGIHMSKTVKSAVGMQFASQEISLNLYVDGKDLDLSMPFHYPELCNVIGIE